MAEAATSDKAVNGSSNTVVCVPRKPSYYHCAPIRALFCLLECLGIEAFNPTLQDNSSSSSSSSENDNQQGEAGADPPAPTPELSPSLPAPPPTEESAVGPNRRKRQRPPPVVTGPPQTNNVKPQNLSPYSDN